MKRLLKVLTILFITGFVIVSCEKEDEKIEHIHDVNSEILEMMKEVYLWYDRMPTNVNPNSYSDPAEFIAALRYDTYDRWSTAMTLKEFNDYFVAGEMIGHGFMIGLDAGNNFRIISVYRNTEADVKGIRRGWIISKVNGTVLTTTNFSTLLGEHKAGITNNFEFNDNGVVKNISLTKHVVEITPVVDFEIINHSSKKIGYLVFQDFIESANAELDEIFDSINQAGGVDEMVVDFRYNGGGSVDVALHLAGWLLGKTHAAQPFIYYQHNRKMTSLDAVFKIPSKTNGLDLSRIFFIGTDGTASASELVINGVSPFIPAILAGSTTHGKPVGMYAITISDYVTLPITFKYTNHDNEGDFYDGLVPQLPAADDFSRDFGDPQEASLKAVLDYIDGTVPVKSAKTIEPGRQYVLKTGKAMDQFIMAF